MTKIKMFDPHILRIKEFASETHGFAYTVLYISIEREMLVRLVCKMILDIEVDEHLFLF
jgi:hypothetical protein